MVCVANFALVKFIYYNKLCQVISYVQFWLCKAQFKQSVLLICMKTMLDHGMKHPLRTFPGFLW